MAHARRAGALLLLLAACLALGAAHVAAEGLLLARPEGDCLAPALDSLSYNFWPKPYQLQSIRSSGGADRSSSDTGLSTTVRACGVSRSGWKPETRLPAPRRQSQQCVARPAAAAAADGGALRLC